MRLIPVPGINLSIGLKCVVKRVLPFAGVTVLGILLLGCQTAPRNSLAAHDSSRWRNDITALQTRDQINPPPAGCILFVGSSSIKFWTNLVADFPDLPVVNHGFGGSQLADSVNYADRIVIPLAPRQVVIYAGGNDISAGKSPEVVYGDFVALAAKLRAALPQTRIAFISSAPNPSRWNQVEKIKRLNSLVAVYCRRHDLDFINVFPLMLGADGLPRPDIFCDDRLHMNLRGYEIWKNAVRPYLR